MLPMLPACADASARRRGALEQAIEEAREYRRQASSRIVVPDDAGGALPAVLRSAPSAGLQIRGLRRGGGKKGFSSRPGPYKKRPCFFFICRGSEAARPRGN